MCICEWCRAGVWGRPCRVWVEVWRGCIRVILARLCMLDIRTCVFVYDVQFRVWFMCGVVREVDFARGACVGGVGRCVACVCV